MYLIAVSSSMSAASRSAWRGLEPAVAADVEVVAFLVAMRPKVLALGFRTFTYAAGDGGFDFVRGAEPLVPVLHANRKADTFLHAVAAPGGADAALYRAECLAIGVSALESRGDELFPDVGEIPAPERQKWSTR